ncbi:nucleoside triphosphate hydrolase [Pacificoceanicola onchidii]|uniref:nucleoside triphosphate hydrolase n=1 Tax=Pacificoceanicola onchidii TaxID=2562685 RepID=UPI0010A302D1|nr:nucleoside triphosphate hydrolase [Pacificoceanicola onchidii]
MSIQKNADRLTKEIAALPARQGRTLVAIAGAPGSGKSTLAETVVALLNAAGMAAVMMPMDGFHLDNRLLESKGLLARKGAPETFDFGGLEAALHRVRAGDQVFLPVFDRSREIAIAAATEIQRDTRFVVVEGNYLLLDEPPWTALAPLWDMTVFLDVPLVELERRLISRWIGFGYDMSTARAKAESNDLPNARCVTAGSRAADLVLT